MELPHNATVFTLILRIGLTALGVCLGCAPRLVQAQDFCQSCEVQWTRRNVPLLGHHRQPGPASVLDLE